MNWTRKQIRDISLALRGVSSLQDLEEEYGLPVATAMWKELDKPGMSTKVASLPKCDVHIAYRLAGAGTVLARYDGATTEGPWANMCQDCFNWKGVGLGTGRGQLLVLREEGSNER